MLFTKYNNSIDGIFSDLDWKMSLSEICENAKMAREYALLGNYDTSLVYYQGVIQQIQKHIQQLKDDAVMKQEWHQVGKVILPLNF